MRNVGGRVTPSLGPVRHRARNHIHADGGTPAGLDPPPLHAARGNREQWPTLSRRALTSEGFDVIERRQPSLLLNDSVLITGEVDRTTDFERGMPRRISAGPTRPGNPTPW